MSDADYSNLLGDDDGDEFVNPNDVVGQLRKALKAQQRQNKALSEELAGVKTENSTLKGQVTATNLATLLEAKGAEPGIAKFMSGVEADEASVETWLSENGKFFGYDPDKKPAEKGPDATNSAPQSQAKLDPEMEAILASMQKVQNQEANAAPGLALGDEKNLEFLNRVGQNAQSFEDVENALRQAGYFNPPQ